MKTVKAWPFLLEKIAEADPDGSFGEIVAEFPPCGMGGLSEEEVRRCLLRDVERLLNTLTIPPSYLVVSSSGEAVEIGTFREIRRSTLCYGLVAPRGDAVAGKAEALRAAIEEAIRSFEPRLEPDSIRVLLVEDVLGDPLQGSSLRFRVEGVALVRRLPEHLEFSVEANLAEQRSRILR